MRKKDYGMKVGWKQELYGSRVVIGANERKGAAMGPPWGSGRCVMLLWFYWDRHELQWHSTAGAGFMIGTREVKLKATYLIPGRSLSRVLLVPPETRHSPA